MNPTNFNTYHVDCNKLNYPRNYLRIKKRIPHRSQRAKYTKKKMHNSVKEFKIANKYSNHNITSKKKDLSHT
jgi:hypothetical protein